MWVGWAGWSVKLHTRCIPPSTSLCWTLVFKTRSCSTPPLPTLVQLSSRASPKSCIDPTVEHTCVEEGQAVACSYPSQQIINGLQDVVACIEIRVLKVRQPFTRYLQL